MDTRTDFQKHLNVCRRCRHNPNDLCEIGQMLRLHEMVESLKKEKFDNSYCDDCDPVTAPKCNKCIGA
jgi:hypothetical protein